MKLLKIALLVAALMMTLGSTQENSTQAPPSGTQAEVQPPQTSQTSQISQATPTAQTTQASQTAPTASSGASLSERRLEATEELTEESIGNEQCCVCSTDFGGHVCCACADILVSTVNNTCCFCNGANCTCSEPDSEGFCPDITPDNQCCTCEEGSTIPIGFGSGSSSGKGSSVRGPPGSESGPGTGGSESGSQRPRTGPGTGSGSRTPGTSTSGEEEEGTEGSSSGLTCCTCSPARRRVLYQREAFDFMN